jgi:hypothetical protein
MQYAGYGGRQNSPKPTHQNNFSKGGEIKEKAVPKRLKQKLSHTQYTTWYGGEQGGESNVISMRVLRAYSRIGQVSVRVRA